MKFRYFFLIIFLGWFLLSCDTPLAPKVKNEKNLFEVSHNFEGGPTLIKSVPISLTWSQITFNMFEKYTIHRSIIENGEEIWSLKTEIFNPNQLTYTDALDDDFTFRYKVRIVDSNGNFEEAITDQIIIRTTSITVPDECEGLQDAYDMPFIDDGDTIFVNPPTPCTFTKTLEFIGKDVYIKSLAGKEETIFKRGGTIVSMNRGILSGFTFIKGGVNLFGTAVMEDCIITEVYTVDQVIPEFIERSPVVISDTAEIRNCEISNNGKYMYGVSGDGAGMIVRDFATVRDCIISGNSADRNGGGIHISGEPAILNCVIDNNSAAIGGGGMFINGDPTIKNCIIDNNIAGEGGGGILVTFDSHPALVNCVIYGNKSDLPGRQWGAALIEKYSSLTIINSIVWGNSSSGSEDRLWQNASYSDIQGYSRGKGNISATPGFVDPVSGDFHLLPDSPCIDAGNPAEEYNDTNGSRNDMGAYGGPEGNG